MRIGKCPNCNRPLFIDCDPKADFEHVCACPSCGSRDFVFRFFAKEAPAAAGSRQFSLTPEFMRSIRETLASVQYVDLGTVINNLSAHYGLAPASAVFLLNELLQGAGGDEAALPNPLRFVELKPQTVTADELKAWIERAIEKEAPRQDSQQTRQQHSPLLQANEALQKENGRLRSENAALLDALNKARAELDDLR